MRIALLNTGTELLLGDVRDAHLAFIAHEIFPLGLRIAEQRTVSDDMAIRDALADLFTRTEILFVTGGLGPTTDDITRDVVAEDLLRTGIASGSQLLSSLRKRLKARGIKWTPSIGRQAGFLLAHRFSQTKMEARRDYAKPNINPQVPSPHLIVLPGPLRELNRCFEPP
jgi:nicotinamide-nucleotide amidase